MGTTSRLLKCKPFYWQCKYVNAGRAKLTWWQIEMVQLGAHVLRAMCFLIASLQVLLHPAV